MQLLPSLDSKIACRPGTQQAARRIQHSTQNSPTGSDGKKAANQQWLLLGMSPNRRLLSWHNASFWQKSSHRYCPTQIHKWWFGMDGCAFMEGRKEWDEMRRTRVCEWLCNPHSSATGCVYHGLLGLLVVILWWCGGWRLSRWQEKVLLKCMWVHITMSASVQILLIANCLFLARSEYMGRQWKERIGDVLQTQTHTNTYSSEHLCTLKQILKKKNLACISGAEHSPNVPGLSSRPKGRRMQGMLWLFFS